MSETKVHIDRDAKKITMEREFDAPLELVWRAYSDPDLITKWWGPRNYETVVDVMEFVPEGRWRFIHKDEKGQEYAFRGEYREIDPPNKITWTFEWEGMPGHILVETMEFTDLDEKTMIRTTSQFEKVEDLDGMVNMGMEKGATETWDRLEETVVKMQHHNKQ